MILLFDDFTVSSVFFYVAENAPIAVVLFRKEKQLFEMISWNLVPPSFSWLVFCSLHLIVLYC